ncbi:MAG TPA: metallophosphoesterase [Myxococcus sp.]|nr:metallophosphoesterase [Myxococcus sp.]
MTITWLHLSDIHIREKKDWESDIVLRALIRDLPSLLAEHSLNPDLVFLTGDIAQSGKRQEFENAHRFMLQLGEATKLTPAERFFLVPGNHDVDRSAVNRIVESHHQRVLSYTYEKIRTEVGDILGNSDLMKFYGERLQNFCDFTGKALGNARGVTPQRPFRTDQIQIKNTTVGIASLCSAWTSGPTDRKGVLLLGERQVRDMLDEIADSDLRFALLHHPLSWLHDAEEGPIRSLLSSKSGVHAVASGHLHEDRTVVEQTPGNSCLFLSAGAVYQESPWKKGFLAGQIDPLTGSTRIYFFVFSPQGRGFWSIDSSAIEGASNGVAQFSLNPLPTLKSSSGRVTTLWSRVRAAVERVYGQVRFIGLPDHAPKPNASLEDLFIPLNLAKSETVGHGDTVPLDHVTERIKTASQNPLRAVILGAPGSGKTTLINYLALTCSHESTHPTPLVLTVRDYARDNSKSGILGFIASNITRRLSVPVTEDQLILHCQNSNTLLLVDGLDEVGNDSQRVELRDHITAIATAYPQMSIIVTTRIVGYDRARLPSLSPHKQQTHDTKHTFEHLWLVPFSDKQLEEYISAWYRVAEPVDPIARDQGRTDLLAALASEPRAKELARNPLLATLICLVHRHESRLPSERAKLYELCVRLLIETWPAARRKTFSKLDVGQQRHALEQIAFSMQSKRNYNDQGVTITRANLESRIAGALQEGPTSNANTANLRRTAREWVDYLQEGSGIIIEQSPGVFSFLHLSLLEYLAGQALMHQEQALGYKHLAHVISQKLKWLWWEPLTLLMGSESDNLDLAQQVFDELLPRAKNDKLVSEFLLACMRDDVSFRPEQCHQILEISCIHQQTHSNNDFIEIARFSRRHKELTISWFSETLRTSSGRLLSGAVKAAPLSESSQIENLDNHINPSLAAQALLFHWPRPIGKWALTKAAESAIVRFIMRRARRGNAMRIAEFAILEGNSRLAAAACAALLQRSGAVTGSKQPASLVIVDTRGQTLTGRHVSIGPAYKTKQATVLSPPNRWKQHDLYPSASTLNKISDKIARSHIRSLLLAQAHIARRLRPAPSDERRKPEDALVARLLKTFGINGATYAGSIFKSLLHPELKFGLQPAPSPIYFPPNQNRLWKRPLRRRLDLRPAFPWAEVLLDLTLGFATAKEAPDFEVLPIIRAENRIANSLIELLYEHLTLSQETHALILAIGLAQYQTTWEWPSGRHWKTHFSGSPPKHWLPAFFWHLCWHVGSPGDIEHRAKALTMIKMGRKEWPELAKQLRRWMPYDNRTSDVKRRGSNKTG